ncbi:hypothetical protein FACS1894151_03500 [Spirochaetia bacterium]|nr:hypothetical protein FACS1894151_03500 [Spirochaetia bacterium]
MFRSIKLNKFRRCPATDYVRQHKTEIQFSSGESWVILSPIEQQIKAKIEKVGIPLKDWDVSINYGIKTGCNEAFIIDRQKRDELITKDAKSADIIRPILRGRDIKRYGYEFADLYLIATFPSKKYNIDDYPAVRDYLLEYGKEKLEQSGKPNARKKTNNKWFETQDAIAYWEDFSHEKITWGNLNLNASFTLAPANMYINAPATMIIPADKYLLGILNSKLADYYIRNLGVTRNGGYFEYKPMFVSQLPVPYPTKEQRALIETYVQDILQGRKKEAKFEDALNAAIYDLYQLVGKEKDFICKVNTH